MQLTSKKTTSNYEQRGAGSHVGNNDASSLITVKQKVSLGSFILLHTNTRQGVIRPIGDPLLQAMETAATYTAALAVQTDPSRHTPTSRLRPLP